MKKQDFETYQKSFWDFKILPKFSETHVFQGTIHHPSYWYLISGVFNFAFFVIVKKYHKIWDPQIKMLTNFNTQTENSKYHKKNWF